MQKLLVKHTKGSKANQTEAFELPITELTLGRDPASDIRFDPERDDIVGRTHAKLTPAPGSADAFTITDLNSRNGTFLNGYRILGSAPVNPGDVIKLGETGPELVFDLDPRPISQPKLTRVVEAAAPATREISVPTSSSSSTPSATSSVPPPSPAPGSIGRNTVERLISETRSDTRKKIINIASVIIVLILLVGGYLLWQDKQGRKEMASAVTTAMKQQKEETGKEINALKEENEGLRNDIANASSSKGMSASQIAKEYLLSTVYVEASWKLVHVPTGGQLYQRSECYQRNKAGHCLDEVLPWYVSVQDTVEPWLRPEDHGPDGRYIPIGSSGQGSGFVVTDEGFILTNRHVAASWETRYSGLSLPGYLLICSDPSCVKSSVKRLDNRDDADREYIRSLSVWVPSKTKTLGGKPMKGKLLEGRNDYLDVTFPNTRIRIPAHLARVSDIADVAMIKIDLPQKQKPVILGGEDPVNNGETITVMGYPAVSPDVEGKIKSQDPLNRSGEWRVIPQPTISPSSIAKILDGQAKVVGNTVSEYFSEMGDVYQLNLNTIGAGNSGGPVFNDQGQVIGIFTYGNRDAGGIQNSFAVPIKYGLEIMGVQSIIK